MKMDLFGGGGRVFFDQTWASEFASLRIRYLLNLSSVVLEIIFAAYFYIHLGVDTYIISF